MTDKYAILKWLVLVAAIAGAIVLVTPPVDKQDPAKSKLKLGIDLKGGVSITVQLDENEARRSLQQDNPELSGADLDQRVAQTLEGAQGRALEVIRNRVDALGVAEPVI